MQRGAEPPAGARPSLVAARAWPRPAASTLARAGRAPAAAARSARTADYVIIAGVAGPALGRRRRRRRTPTLWQAAPSTARSARCRCARRCGRPARPTAGSRSAPATTRAGSAPSRSPRRARRRAGHRAAGRHRREPARPAGRGRDTTRTSCRTARCPARWPSRCAAPSRSARARRSRAARPFGRVDRYEPDAARRARGPLLSSCVLSIVDLGTVAGDRTRAGRRRRHAPTPLLARVLAARPERSLLIVAGRRGHRPVVAAARRDRRRAGLGRRLADLAEHRPRRLPAARRPRPDRAGRARPAAAGEALRRPAGRRRARPPRRPADAVTAPTTPTAGGRPAYRRDLVLRASRVRAVRARSCWSCRCCGRARRHAGPAAARRGAGAVVAASRCC